MSDQLNTLRNLLEARLKESIEINSPSRDNSILRSSPATFTKDFLRSCHRSKENDPSKDVISDLDDNDNDDYPLVRPRNFNYYDRETSNNDEILTKSTISPRRYGNLLTNSHEFKSPLPKEFHHTSNDNNETLSSASTVTPNIMDPIETCKETRFLIYIFILFLFYFDIEKLNPVISRHVMMKSFILVH